MYMSLDSKEISMDPVPATTSVEQFLTAMRTRTGAGADTELRQSMEQGLRYYRYLRIILNGGAPPSVVEFMEVNFYPFAQAVLDNFTVAFCAFFALPWLRAEMTHARLTRDFADLCREHKLQGPIADVHAFMRDLYVRVVARRTDSSTGNMPDSLSEVLTCIDQYIAAMLRFCEQNIQQSIFRQHPGSARSAGSSG